LAEDFFHFLLSVYILANMKLIWYFDHKITGIKSAYWRIIRTKISWFEKICLSAC
jgi:hypothetical protein